MPAPAAVVAEALAHVEQGFAAFALKANAKVPNTSRGFKDATTNPDWIRTQLQAPDAGNYGIVWLTTEDPLLAFDLDDGGGADRPWRDRILDLIERLGPLPATKSTNTPSGGRHVFYRWPASVPIPPGDELFGFTVRWPGRGYLVGPGSMIDGRAYEPGPVREIAELPARWVEAAVAEHGASRRNGHAPATGTIVVDGGFALPERIPSGRRYATVRDYVASRYNAGLDVDELWQLVRTQVAPRFTQPKTEDDLRADFERVIAKIGERLGPPRNVPKGPRPAEVIAASSIDAADLLELDIPPLQWIVRDLIPEGTTVLAAPPKVGKSCLVYQVAVEVAVGGQLFDRPVEQGDVLYLALEDGKRRGQMRLRNALEGRAMPRNRLEVRWSAAKIGEGLEEEIVAWLDEHPAARLVAIDTLQKARARGDSRRNAYEVDVEDLGRIQSLFRDRPVALVVVHHSKKEAGDDFLASVSGTYGITGSADTTLVIQRKRLEAYGKLVVTGRDIEEAEVSVEFSGMTWRPAPAVLVAGTFEQQEVYAVIAASDKPLFPSDVAETLDKGRSAVAELFGKLASQGAIVRVDGGYVVPGVRIVQSAESANRAENSDTADSADSSPRARARTRVPTDSTDSADGTDSKESAESAPTHVRAREDDRPALRVVPGGDEHVTCHFYRDHQSSHRRVGDRWLCPICDPDPEEDNPA
jgi:hypothetical protein